MSAKRTTVDDDVRCPECGGVLELDPACEVGYLVASGYVVRDAPLTRRTRIAPAALCTACEFCIEIER